VENSSSGTAEMSAATTPDAVTEGDFRRLAEELPLRIGDPAAGVLAVGSVGRNHQDGFSPAARPGGDYDIILAVDGMSQLQRLRAKRRVQGWLRSVEESLSLPVSVGVLALSEFPRLPFTLFNYEMRCGRRVLAGADPTARMPAYRAERMPLIEATRLLLNRGVTLWGDALWSASPLTPEEATRIARRNRKALMAIGDALLIAGGKYDWSFRGRLANLSDCAAFDGLDGLRVRYAEALESAGSPPPDRFSSDEATGLLALHAGAFRLVEERRLGRLFAEWREYAECALQYPSYLSPSPLKRLFHLVKSFGAPRGYGFYRRHLGEAPEEVLLRAFPGFAYQGGAGLSSERMLNWRLPGSVEAAAVWRRFSRAWARGG
jgi:hypothetical protein